MRTILISLAVFVGILSLLSLAIVIWTIRKVIIQRKERELAKQNQKNHETFEERLARFRKEREEGDQ